jgi:hypothetical protein
VRLNATGRWLGLLLGPAVGGGIMLALGPAHGIIVNAFIYLPLVLWLWKAPYGTRAAGKKTASAGRGLAEIVSTMRAIAGNRTIVSMTLLSGGAALFVGNAYQAQMPEFAHDLGHGAADMSYSLLLAADAAGALIAGLVLESRGTAAGSSQDSVRSGDAVVLRDRRLRVVDVVSARARAPGGRGLPAARVQRHGADAGPDPRARADPRPRDRAYTMSSLGLRAFAGVTVGLMGSFIGVHWSLALSAMALFAVIAGLLGFTLRTSPRNG